jgi:hypothetical protein
VAAGLIALAGCDLGARDENRASRFGNPDFVAYVFEDEEEGRVGLSAAGSRRTRIAIEIDDPSASRQRWEIRTGTCPPIGPWGGVQYEPRHLVDGESEAVVPVPLRELVEFGYVLFIYPGPAANNVSVTCVDLTQAEPTA